MSEISELRADIRALRSDMAELLSAIGPLLPPVKNAQEAFVLVIRSTGGEVFRNGAGDITNQDMQTLWEHMLRYDWKMAMIRYSRQKQAEMTATFHSLQRRSDTDRFRLAAYAMIELAADMELLERFNYWAFYEHPFHQPDVRTPCVPTLAAAQRARLVE